VKARRLPPVTKRFTNPVTVRSDPVQLVSDGGSWEAQCVCDVDDFTIIRDTLMETAGGPLGVRMDGSVVEVFATHDTKTAAEGTIERWERENA